MPIEITIQVTGSIEHNKEKVICLLDVPVNWEPNWMEFSKVKGAIRYLEEELSQRYTPDVSGN